jgi:integrase
LPNFGVSFREQSQLWLKDLATRRRKPVSPATLRTFGSYVRRLRLMLGETRLTDINNGTLRRLVQRLDDEKLSPKTVNELVAVIKQVVASAVDDDGNQVHRREWNHSFIDLPVVSEQKQRCVTAKEVERCIEEAASDQEKLFYCVLAGSGLRVSEALAIHVAGLENQTLWTPESAAVDVRSSIFNGREIPRLKTLAARRTVDLDPSLSDLIARYVESNGIQPGHYLFQARSGRPTHLKTARQRLAKRNIPGFHSFRRFRTTRLREVGIPEDILRYWVGHAGRGITDRYSKLAECADLRKQWAARAELGFALPEICKSGHPAPSPSKSPQPVSAPEVFEPLQPQQPAYIAEDNDLDLFFYSPVPEEAA